MFCVAGATQGQAEISRNQVQTLFLGSVLAGFFPLEGMSRCAPPVAAGPSTFNLTHRDRYLGTVVAYLEKEI